jgi:hypothetical protein
MEHPQTVYSVYDLIAGYTRGKEKIFCEKMQGFPTKQADFLVLKKDLCYTEPDYFWMSLKRSLGRA